VFSILNCFCRFDVSQVVVCTLGVHGFDTRWTSFRKSSQSVEQILLSTANYQLIMANSSRTCVSVCGVYCWGPVTDTTWVGIINGKRVALFWLISMGKSQLSLAMTFLFQCISATQLQFAQSELLRQDPLEFDICIVSNFSSVGNCCRGSKSF